MSKRTGWGWRTLCMLASFVPVIASCQAHEPARQTPPPKTAITVASAEPQEGNPIVHHLASHPPMALTASDGTGLRLVSVAARSIVEGPLGFTELHLTFDNPESRTLEGRFNITLPPRATVARFAMLTERGWQEAEVVESKAARRAYEDFLHRKQDPALLEQSAGNEFSARVFPIAPRARKQILLSYAQELVSGALPMVPLQGLPEVDLVDVSLRQSGATKPFQALRKEHYKPQGDFGFDPASLSRGPGLRSGELAVVRIRPNLDAQPDPLRSAAILVDTSASRALGFDAQIDLVERIVRKISSDGGPGAKIAVGCFDQKVDSAFEGEAAGFQETEKSKIRSRLALGASDLEQALQWAGDRSKALGLSRLILITDGVITAGESEPSRIRRSAAALAASGIERIDVVAVGGLRDDALLAGLVNAGLPRAGVVVPSDASPSAVEQKLTRLTRSDLAVQVEGADWFWPSKLQGVQPGDEILLYARVSEGRPITVLLQGEPAKTYELATVGRPVLERAVARAKIESLLEANRVEGPDQNTIAEIVALSRHNRVLSPYTSFLVLETEADYERFHIDRRALSDILVVRNDRVVSVRREGPGAQLQDKVVRTWSGTSASPAMPVASGTATATATAVTQASARPVQDPNASNAPSPTEVGDAFGAGGLGLSGIGEGGSGQGEGIGLGNIGTLGHGAGTGQGFGSGHGRLGGAHRTRPPTVRMGATTVNGRLPVEVVQRIVRQKYGRFRLCYEAGLRNNPNLQGRVAVRFVIDATGAVRNPTNAGSDLPSAEVVACVIRAFSDLSFPQPQGGVVTVIYPIFFTPGDGPTEGAPRSSAPDEKPAKADPYTGRFKEVMQTLAAQQADKALEQALAWRLDAPGDVLAYVALGEAAEARRDPALASRAYGSIIDLYPARADLRRFAGGRLERLGNLEAQQLALDSFLKAREQRADHPSSHRLLAFAQLRAGQPEKAFETLEGALKRTFPLGRFAGVERILREDLGLVAAAWTKAAPSRATEIAERLTKAGGTSETGPSLRFVLTWETDANDVDFHIFDDKGGHAYYRKKALPSGGELYADVTTGYGPECFTIRKPRAQRAAAYTLQANYYSRGPMGYGMGKLEILEHDGKGGLTFEQRPYVVMVDRGFVDLGVVKR